ncbi:MAG: hypothetical protein ACKPKO_24735, partial [Candidatus Fonsibacter sp.]
MVDSSPQGGRDYEMMVRDFMAARHLSEAFIYLQDLYKARLLVGRYRAAVLPDESSSLDALKRHFVRLTPPPVVLGSGASYLGHKFEAHMHYFLLVSPDVACLHMLSQAVVS